MLLIYHIIITLLLTLQTGTSNIFPSFFHSFKWWYNSSIFFFFTFQSSNLRVSICRFPKSKQHALQVQLYCWCGGQDCPCRGPSRAFPQVKWGSTGVHLLPTEQRTFEGHGMVVILICRQTSVVTVENGNTFLHMHPNVSGKLKIAI